MWDNEGFTMVYLYIHGVIRRSLGFSKCHTILYEGPNSAALLTANLAYFPAPQGGF